jgi:hypothetical protein
MGIAGPDAMQRRAGIRHFGVGAGLDPIAPGRAGGAP